MIREGQGEESGEGQRKKANLFHPQFFPIYPSSVYSIPCAHILHHPNKVLLLPLHIPKVLTHYLHWSSAKSQTVLIDYSLYTVQKKRKRKKSIDQRYFHHLCLACCENPNTWQFCIVVSGDINVSDLWLCFEPKHHQKLSEANHWELEVNIAH